TPTVTHTAAATGTPTATETEPSAASPTPTPTEEAFQTPTPTGGPSVPRRGAAAIESTTNAFLVIPNLLSAVLGHSFGFGGNSAAIDIGPIPFTCPGGGGGSISCSQ